MFVRSDYDYVQVVASPIELRSNRLVIKKMPCKYRMLLWTVSSKAGQVNDMIFLTELS